MKGKVLIIDDAAFARRTLKNLLEENGFDVIGEAENGANGILQYKKLNPDIVTMDIVMEGVNGIEALEGILDYDSKAKVVMVTARAEESMVRKAVMRGAKNFIVKPYKRDVLIGALEKTLKA